VDDYSRTFRFESQDPASLSRALHGALADGLMVIDVVPELKDLETILKEAVVT
jgi:hypothetical protein